MGCGILLSGLKCSKNASSGVNLKWLEIMWLAPKSEYLYMEAYRSGCNELHSKCSCPQGHVGSNPTASAIKALKTLCFRGFFFCSGSIYFGENNSNGALGAPLCGARLILYHTHYTRKMYTVVPQWCPELLKSYEKQRGAIKRYCRYSSISLLFFFAFFDVSCPASFPVTVVFGCSALW